MRLRIALALFRLAGRVYELAAWIEPPAPACDCGCGLSREACDEAERQQQELDRMLAEAEAVGARDGWRDAEIHFGVER